LQTALLQALLGLVYEAQLRALWVAWGLIRPAARQEPTVSLERLIVGVLVLTPLLLLLPTTLTCATRHPPRFAASLRTDISPQRKEARPLSHALTSD
jgi:hypothetical protein